MSRALSALTLSAIMAAGVLMLGAASSSAGQRDGLSVGIGIGVGHGYYGRQYRYDRPQIPRSGPALYYGYHHDHAPAYPAPIYRTDKPSIVYRQPRMRYRSGGSHVDWCYARYRSYRVYDDTFQPYRGGRRRCWSPYG